MTAAEMILLTILMCSASMAFSNQMENFEAGKCKFGTNDLVVWGISYVKCLQECRGRTACTSVNVNLKAGVCRLNFDANIQKESCGLYVYSEKSSWKQKTLCDVQNCGQESNVKINSDCTCTVEECKKLTGPDDCFLMGNGRLIGHNVSYVYRNTQDVNTSVRYKRCMKNGTWSGEPIENCAGRLIPTPAPTQSRTGTGHTTEITAPTETSAPTTVCTTTKLDDTTESTAPTETNAPTTEISNKAWIPECPMPADTSQPRYGSKYQKYNNKMITDPRNLTKKEPMLSFWDSLMSKSWVFVNDQLIKKCNEDSNCRAVGRVANGGKINVMTYHGEGQFEIGEPTGDFVKAVLFVRTCAFNNCLYDGDDDLL